MGVFLIPPPPPVPNYPLHPPPGLYVHIPFCLSRCAYCAFVSNIYNAEATDAYIDALAVELSLRSACFEGRKPVNLFIGGGTPSCLTVRQLDKLLSILPIPENGAEATCEMNPDSVDADKLRLLRDRGITRCSFGVQTFSPEGLAMLGRRHGAAAAREKIELAAGMGFASINIDLITAWPEQTEECLREDLRTAVELGANHISCYNLILEEESSFYEVMTLLGVQEKEDGEVRRFWDIADERLTEAGFEHYETSNFAKPGFRCQHNVDTWKGKDYLGIGVAAHSHIRSRRFANCHNVSEYIQAGREEKLLEVFSEQLEFEDKARECAVFWLRLAEGIDCREFFERTGYDLLDLYRNVFPDMVERGLLEYVEDGGVVSKVRVGRKYQPVLDSVLVDLI